MTQWNPPGRDDDDEPTRRLPEQDAEHPYAEPTQSTQPTQPTQTADPSDHTWSGGSSTAQPQRRGRRGIGTGLVVALLTAALVVGGLAGLAGAAVLGLVDGGSSTRSSPASAAPASTSSTPSAAVDAGSSGAPQSVQQVAAEVLPSVVKINVTNSQEQGSGSGIVISADGEILTNNHVASVAEQGGSMTVGFNDGTTKKATIVGTDPVTDLAVIKAQDVSGLRPASIGRTTTVAVGENVVAIGSPYGLQATVTSGIVSALNRPVSVQSSEGQGDWQPGQDSSSGTDSTTYPAIQTDAAINPGNSGGPLVNLRGAVVGINSSIRTASSSDSSSSGGSIGLGFAIPIANVRPIVEQLRAGDKPTHAKMGVSVQDASDDGGLLTGAGVSSVTRGSAAASAGIEKGEVVTKVDDEVITGSESLVSTIRGHRPGDTVRITLVKDKDTRTVDVTLDSDADAG